MFFLILTRPLSPVRLVPIVVAPKSAKIVWTAVLDHIHGLPCFGGVLLLEAGRGRFADTLFSCWCVDL